MPEPTKTIAFRVSPDVDRQIDEVAKAEGLNKGEWVRAQVMGALHALAPDNSTETAKPGNTAQTAPDLATRIRETEDTIRKDIAGIMTALREFTHEHHRDLCTIAEVGANAEQTMEQQLEEARHEVLEAITQLRRHQKSETDQILGAITRHIND